MGHSKKGNTRRGRICCLTSAAALLLLFLALLFLYFYLASPAFRSLLEETIHTRTGREIHLGTVAYDPDRGIILKDLILGDRDKAGFFLFLPYAEIGVTWKGIKERRIDHLHLRQPEIDLPLSGEKDEKPRKQGVSLPFRILHGSVEGGRVTLYRNHAPPLVIGAIQLALREGDDGGEADFEGRGLFGETKTPLTIEGRIDPKTLTLKEGRLQIGRTDLAILPAILSLSDPALSLEGTLQIEAELHQEDAGPAGTVTGSVKDLRIGKNDIPLLESSAGDLHLRFARTGAGDLHLQATLDTASMRIATREVTVTREEATRFTAEGIVPVRGNRIEGLHLKAELPGMGNLLFAGSLSKISTKNPELNLTIRGEEISLDETVNHLSGPAFAPLQDLQIGGQLSGSARITGTLKDPRAEGDLRIEEGTIEIQGKSPGPLQSETTFRYDKKGVTLPRFSVTTQDLGEATGTLTLTPGAPQKLSVQWKQKNLSLARLKSRFPEAFPGLVEAELHGQGTLSTTLTMTQKSGNPPLVQGRSLLQLNEGGFSSPDGSRMGEGIHLNLSTQYDFSLPLRRLRFSADAAARDFELLLGGFYGNFKDRPLSLSLQGLYLPGRKELRLKKADLSLEKIGALHASGKITDRDGTARYDFQTRTTPVALGPFFDFFFRETFQESHPELSTLEVGGNTILDLALSGTRKRYQTQGTLTVRDLKLHGGPSTSIEGGQLHLPFDLRSPQMPHQPAPADFGTLTIDRLTWKGIQIRHLAAHPLIEGNRLHFKEEIAFPLLGGNITLEEISYKDLLNPDRTLTLSVGINDLDLTEASTALQLPPFSGRVTGTMSKVHLAGRRLTTEGDIRLHLFGGEVRIDGIAAEHLFTPIPSLHASVFLKEINLRQLTDIFEFGKISGILEGEIRDLVITRGQPERFQARIETVPTKGVPQKISVEALEKISILGSGASPTLFGRGIYQLFKEYRYSRMGFRSSLKNDKFVLYGIERFGNRGYLVKGSFLPPKVNVINYTQDISFREMVKRLQRIRTSGKSKSGADE